MEKLRLVCLLCAIKLSFQEGIYNILGDPVKFSATKNKSGAKLVHRLKDGSSRPVAHWDDGWKPEPGYRDRMSPGDSVIFNSTNINDNGLYELTGTENPIQLHVIVPSEVSVTEGKDAKLNFHHMTVGLTVRYIRCERNKTLVFEANLFSGNITYGSGSEGRVFVSPAWKTQGNFSSTLQPVQQEDQGDYFFYALDKDRERTGGNPVAVRMKVNRPAEEKMDTGTIVAIIEAVILFILVSSFLWWLKSPKSKLSSGPGGGRPAAAVLKGLLTERGPAGS